MLLDAARTLGFLFTELPTFTRIGHDCRSLRWPQANWRFDGQRWLVTGASTGIGREIARVAASRGAEVVAVARSRDKLQSLAQSVPAGTGRVTAITADLSLIAENRRVVDRVATIGPLDVLVNNVGVLQDAPAMTGEGIDLAFATNLLGPFELTRSLTARHCFREHACVINMSSGGMYAAALDIGALARQDDYDGVIAYARQKRAQVVLNAIWRATAATDRDIYVMHPGWVETPGVARSLPTFRAWLRPLLRDVAAGADTALWLAATRPAQATPEGIWFDRALRPAHVLPTSRNGDLPEALVPYLESALARVGESRSIVPS